MSQAPSRGDFRRFVAISTRWMDNDVYGHVNNVHYYSFFDTTVNQALIEAGVLDPHGGARIALVVDSGCTFLRPISFPQAVTGGLAVERVGGSSVRYRLGLFAGDEAEASATGHFVHVYVDRATRRSASVPEATRRLLAGWVV